MCVQTIARNYIPAVNSRLVCIILSAAVNGNMYCLKRRNAGERQLR